MLPKHLLVQTPEYVQEIISNAIWNHPKNTYAKGKKGIRAYLSSKKCDAIAKSIMQELNTIKKQSKKPKKKKAAKKK